MSLQPNTQFKVINTNGGTSLDLDNRENIYVNGWNYNGVQHQKWELIQDGNYWRLRNVSTCKYLAVENPGQGQPWRNGLRVIGSNDVFNWEISNANNNNAKRLKIPGTNFVVDLQKGSSQGGTPVQIWTNYDDNHNQTWRFERV